MKKGKAFAIFLIGLVLGVLGAAGVYFLTVGQVAWEIYLEEELIPSAVTVISAVGALAVVAIPIINRVSLELNKFGAATNDIRQTVELGKKTDGALEAQDKLIADAIAAQDEKIADAIAAQDEKIAAFGKDFEDLKRLINERTVPLVSSIENTEKIVRLGFCNLNEVVEKGYAVEIQRVGKEVGKNEEGKEAAEA